MKCGASPPSIAPSGSEARRAQRSREIAADFEALLYQAAFAPLSKAMGFYGDVAVASAAQTMARGERGGLTDYLERAIETAQSSATPQ